MYKKILLCIGFCFLLFGVFSTFSNAKEFKTNKEEIAKLENDVIIEKEGLVQILDEDVALSVNNDIEEKLNSEDTTISLNENIIRDDVSDITCEIVYDDGFKVNGILDISNGKGFHIPVENKEVDYNSQSNNYIIGDYFVSIVSDSKQVEQNVQIYGLEELKNIIYGQKSLDDINSFNILKELIEEENLENEKNKMLNILDSVVYSKEKYKFIINNLQINEIFLNKICINKDNIVLSTENGDSIVFKKYENNIDNDYFSKKEKINNISIKYGTIINDDDNLVFYVIDGKVPLLMVAKKEISLNQIFIDKTNN